MGGSGDRKRCRYFVILVWTVVVLLLRRGSAVTLMVFAVSVITRWLDVRVISTWMRATRELQGLLEVLAEVPDPRRRRGPSGLPEPPSCLDIPARRLGRPHPPRRLQTVTAPYPAFLKCRIGRRVGQVGRAVSSDG